MKKVKILLASLVFIVSCSSQNSLNDDLKKLENSSKIAPPKELSKVYENTIDTNISDDFSSLDKTKWTYRKPDKLTGDSEKYVSIVDNSYLSIKCDVKDKKGGGISGLNYCRFGFFITKFRIRGIQENGPKSHTHPAIWGNRYNMGVDGRRAPVEGNDYMELDWVEYYAWSKKNCWDIDAPPDLDGVRHKELISVMLEHDVKTKFGDWETVGLEFNPDYMQAWEYVNGQWQKLGRKVPAGDVQTRDTMKRTCFQNMHWILSNGYFGHAKGSDQDSWLDVDYFYYFPLKNK
ncbi:hypothetical protein [Flavobacterium sp. UMI-01]|uniref:hypothetical protein n=1 Tax=Flavobacterium sp. UMI-01 TaxID=1441053 RepID=UPI001C7DCBDA|nr:hypothetical protein [Flavobacterium sp. UMI-01]GIZ09659.1 hypothetical protein FUMI01_23860 [Flavobacterium sp. UMI-01]